MKTTKINDKTYHIGKSTFSSDCSALFETFVKDGRKYRNEYLIFKEWHFIKDDPDRYEAYQILTELNRTKRSN